MQHRLQGLQGSLRQRILFASADQRVAGDHVWREALVQHCLKISRALCGSVPFSQTLIKALYVMPDVRMVDAFANAGR